MLVALKPTQETIDIVAALKGRWHGSYAMCICPAHADRTPSLSVRQGERGILVHCFAGCRSEDVLREIGRTKPILNSSAPSYQPERTGGLSSNGTENLHKAARLKAAGHSGRARSGG
jgi:hypothetical protein